MGNSDYDLMGFTAHPSNPTVFYSSGHSPRAGNLGFQISEDGGFTWKKVSNGIRGPVDFHVLSADAALLGIFYGWYDGKLQKSDDEGKTWELLSPDLPDPISFIPHPKKNGDLYAVTLNGIYLSMDSGEKWIVAFPELKSAGATALAIDPANPDNMLVFSRKFGLQKSADSGKTWQNISETLGGGIAIHITIAKKDPNTAYIVTHAYKIYKSTDAGNTWEKIF